MPYDVVSRLARTLGLAFACALFAVSARAQSGPFDYTTIQVDLVYRSVLITNDYTSFSGGAVSPHGVHGNPFGLSSLPEDMHVRLTLDQANQGGAFHHGYGWHAAGSATELGSILWSYATPNFVTTGIAAADAPYVYQFNGPLIGLDYSGAAGTPSVHYLNFAYSDSGGVGVPGDRWIWFSQSHRTAFVNDPGAGYIGYELAGASFLVNGFGQYSGPVTSPVPEPETYAMLLAGLGLLGFAARRRKAKSEKARTR